MKDQQHTHDAALDKGRVITRDKRQGKKQDTQDEDVTFF
jgi:hypothetical protein